MQNSLIKATFGEFFRYNVEFYDKEEVLNNFARLGLKCGHSLAEEIVETAGYEYYKKIEKKINNVTLTNEINSNMFEDITPKNVLGFTSTRDVENLIVQRVFPMIFKRDQSNRYKAFTAPTANEAIFKGVSISSYPSTTTDQNTSNISSSLAYIPQSSIKTQSNQISKSEKCKEIYNEIKKTSTYKLLGIERFSIITLTYSPYDTKLFTIPQGFEKQLSNQGDGSTNTPNSVKLYNTMIEATGIFIEMLLKELITCIGFNADISQEKTKQSNLNSIHIAITDLNCYQ